MGHMSSDGRSLSRLEVQSLCEQVQSDGVAQFARVLSEWHARSDDALYWGDELEFIVLQQRDRPGRYRLFTEAAGYLRALNDRDGGVAKWNHEFGSYMIEATPNCPYTDQRECLEGGVEESMRQRRAALQRRLGADQSIVVVCMANFPLLGADGRKPTSNAITLSRYADDALINQQHPRFGNLAVNIRERRQDPVDIRIAAFQDLHTAAPDIHMDAMTFGMGCCCLQMTFQSRDIREARRLFDQFVVLAPVGLALSAACPIFRGVLSSIDCRWRVISGAVDDRTDGERNPADLAYINKSRYASISRYLDHLHLNDLALRYNERVIQQVDRDFPFIDEGLKMHLAHLFVREPLVVYEHMVRVDNAKSTEHFDNIQSTNWQTVRFKLPTSSVDGWRVEFRPMDIQFTDFENAAFAIWTCLFARIVVHFDLDFCIPISQVDENMELADAMDSVTKGLFWFKLNGQSRQYTISQIVHHLDGLMQQYVTEHYGECPRIREYLDFVRGRASGAIPTNARFIRDFVLRHPDYQKDSLVSGAIVDDLVDAVLALQ